MAKQVIMEQGSDEWINYRKMGLGASDIPAVLNISPYISANKLWKIKKNVITDYDISEYAKMMGELSEEDAREQFNELTGRVYEPACFEREDNPDFRCSLDGYSPDGQLLEAKFIGNEYFKALQKTREVRPDHYAQLQWQMYVMDAPTCDYFVLNKNSDRQVITVKRDDEYIKNISTKAWEFMKYMEEDIEPPLGPNDYLAVDGDLALLMDELKTVKMAMDSLKNRDVELRAKIIDMATHSKLEHGDVKFYQNSGKARKNYKGFCEYNNIEIPQEFIQKGKGSWTLRVEKPKKSEKN